MQLIKKDIVSGHKIRRKGSWDFVYSCCEMILKQTHPFQRNDNPVTGSYRSLTEYSLWSELVTTLLKTHKK